MKSYVISIFGLEYSELNALRCIESGKIFSIPIQFYSGVNRYRAEEEMEKLGLFLNTNFYSKVSDKPIGDRGKATKGQ